MESYLFPGSLFFLSPGAKRDPGNEDDRKQEIQMQNIDDRLILTVDMVSLVEIKRPE